jgi:hypothetical protein
MLQAETDRRAAALSRRRAFWYSGTMPADIRYVDPRELRVPPSRASGADPFKLQQQIARFGASAAGMPPAWAYECPNGSLLLVNGVTRATRIAKLAPGTLVPVEVIGRMCRARPGDLRLGDLLS